MMGGGGISLSLPLPIFGSDACCCKRADLDKLWNPGMPGPTVSRRILSRSDSKFLCYWLAVFPGAVEKVTCLELGNLVGTLLQIMSRISTQQTLPILLVPFQLFC